MNHYHLKEVKCIRKTEDIRPFIEGIIVYITRRMPMEIVARGV
ncbi:MAG: hypothetical protein P857_717 [Candidatus Xenolissoclinum pacificiensis L6]|uniref:Uncharacterized protein n=1 Tax=Candidatus Xenolissoclinum pacificiensis L6 TaxID=1401685 RepID=W2UYQ0_9RICK|nr:MAG: hypothetical protein P857_717 [Candidatus Xenolissoclinum pacificiensis L6]